MLATKTGSNDKWYLTNGIFKRLNEVINKFYTGYNVNSFGSLLDKKLKGKLSKEDIENISNIYGVYRGEKLRSDYKDKMKIGKAVKGLNLINFDIDFDKLKKYLDEYMNNENSFSFGMSMRTLALNGDKKLFETTISESSSESMKNIKHAKLYECLQNLAKKIEAHSGTPIKNAVLNIVKHVGTEGRALHFDKLWSNGGPLYITNIGIDVYYDLFPIFVKGEPFRVKIPNGYTALLEGEIRYKWVHSVPDNIPGINGRYSIQFKYMLED